MYLNSLNDKSRWHAHQSMLDEEQVAKVGFLMPYLES